MAWNPFSWQTFFCEFTPPLDPGLTITQGVCSLFFENSLISDRVGCGFELESQRTLIFDTIVTLLRRMCETDNVNDFMDSISRPRPRVKRVVPIDGVEEFQGATLHTDLNLGILDDGDKIQYLWFFA